MTTRPRLPADERRQAVLETACHMFCRSSYRGATTAEIAKQVGVSEPVLYRHFASKQELYLACLEEAWQHVKAMWEEALAAEPDPSRWVAAIGKAYIQAKKADKVFLVDLWTQALTETTHDAEIRRSLRDHVREVHRYVVDVMERAQKAGGLIQERDAPAEAWIFISLGLLTTIDRRLGGLVGEEFERILASRRQWMTGRT
jgi:AcrR family transcriptional regulator